jgi:hypothetical protein
MTIKIAPAVRERMPRWPAVSAHREKEAPTVDAERFVASCRDLLCRSRS